MKRTRRLAAIVVSGTSVVCSSTARAFDSKGHDVIEALAYRTLIEGHGAQPPAPDVVRDLINDDALVRPLCFGRSASLTRRCITAPVANPLLEWPEPRSDRPDAAFRRQFSDPGQCYHFMATLQDEESPPLEGSLLPRALATTAIVRCRDLLDDLMRQVVVVGGSTTRDGGHGLYELMHSVADSFSYAHAQRTDTGQIAFLRTWEPIAKLLGGRLGAAYSFSPTRHAAHDPRDEAYVRNFAEVEGRPCRDLTDFPYEVPFACLSDEGDRARQALAELMVVVRDLRRIQLATLPEVDTHPEQSPSWLSYKEKWFSSVTPCRGAECDTRQPSEAVPSNDFLLGLSAVWNPTAQYYGAGLRAMRVVYSWDLNPFLYGVTADVGYRRRYDDGTSYGVAGLELDLLLPVGRRAAVGLAPVLSGFAFGEAHSGPQLSSRALLIETNPVGNLWLELAGPAQIDWITASFEWSFGLTMGLAPSARETSSDTLIEGPPKPTEAADESWSPAPLWYGRLKGREASWYIIGSTTPQLTPDVAIPGRFYGDAVIGAQVMWNRDPWGKRYPTWFGGFVQSGVHNTSADFRYVTGVVGFDLRWYPIPLLGISLVPLRLELGVPVAGTGLDDSRDVHSYGGHSYYVMAGSRLGIAFSAGLIDLLLQAPTLPWRSDPFSAREILTFQVGIRL
jgi:hypothetical protein